MKREFLFKPVLILIDEAWDENWSETKRRCQLAEIPKVITQLT